MRTAIRDIAEGAEMGLETGSMSGLSCGLYGSVDFGEDYREVTGKSAVPEKLYVYGKHSINSPFHSKNVILLL